MYRRTPQPPANQSFFLFGPRGTGKTAWLAAALPGALVFDLLDPRVYARLSADPGRLREDIPPGHADWVVLDEVQRAPGLLHEVHRLLELRGLKFALTGSSARTLRRKGVNLLAGRALTQRMHPLTAGELGADFALQTALARGLLPFACTTATPDAYLASYVATYLREEVLQEGLTRNLAAFGRFLEAASFSQGSLLNMAAVARECAVSAKTVEDYFSILEDLLLAVRLPVFSRRARRRMVGHAKFYFFDAGVFGALRPRGPLDSPQDAQGPALETLVLQHLRAWNDYHNLGYALYFWRTATGDEVDFVLYGRHGLVAIEVKRGAQVRSADTVGLRRFGHDFAEAQLVLLYGGAEQTTEALIAVWPVEAALRAPERWLPGMAQAIAD